MGRVLAGHSIVLHHSDAIAKVFASSSIGFARFSLSLAALDARLRRRVLNLLPVLLTADLVQDWISAFTSLYSVRWCGSYLGAADLEIS